MQCSIGLGAPQGKHQNWLWRQLNYQNDGQAQLYMKIDTIISKYGFAYIMEDMKIAKFNTSKMLTILKSQKKNVLVNNYHLTSFYTEDLPSLPPR